MGSRSSPLRWLFAGRLPWLRVTASVCLLPSIAGCLFAPGGPPARLVTASVASTTASLKLDLRGWQRPSGRRLMVFDETRSGVRVRVTDPRGGLLRERVVPSISAPVLLTDLPVRSRALIEVQGLGLSEVAIPGDFLRAPVVLNAGANACELTSASTVGAAVLQALATADAALVDTIDFDAVASAVLDWQRELRAPSPGLLDPVAIAAAWRAAGATPVATSAFFPPPATLRLVPENWPPGLEASVALSDPTSEPLLFDGLPLDFGPVASGAWSLQVVPFDDGLPLQTFPLSVGPGQTLVRAVSFGGTEVRTPLPLPRGSAAYAVRETPGASDALIIAGGLTQTLGGAVAQGARVASSAIAVGGAAFAGSLPAGLHAAASVAHGGNLYWLGGLGQGGTLSAAVGRMSLTTGDVTPEVTFISDGSGFAPVGICKLAAGLIDDVIYLAGGTRGINVFDDVRAYDVVLNEWLPPEDLPVLPRPTHSMAGVALDGTFYLFGGLSSGATAETGASSQALAWSPGLSENFESLAPMPTPRRSAAAVVFNEQIWVVGGVDNRGRLSGAVEVYDPGRDRWYRRPSLRTPRALPAVGVLNGALWVVGGVLGDTDADTVPVSDVEVIESVGALGASSANLGPAVAAARVTTPAASVSVSPGATPTPAVPPVPAFRLGRGEAR